MNNETILEKAIEKAVKNGWNPEGLEGISTDKLTFEVSSHRITWSLSISDSRNVPLIESSIFGTIFSHSFAKNFFGAEWENNLMSMVRREEPLKYIEKFLNDK